MRYEFRDAIINGDRKTIKKIIDDVKPKFIHVLKKYGATNMECEEYFQISLKGLVENFILNENKDVPNDKFFNYLITIGLNNWKTHCKRKRKEIPTADLPETSFESSILEDILLKEKHNAFMEKFRELGIGCQNLLWKKIVEELSYKEIALELGKNEDYLRVHLNRCKKYLTKLLATDNAFNL